MVRAKITDEELTALIAEGQTAPEIARSKGMTACSVRERLRKLNLQAPNAHKKKQKYEDEDMIRLCKEGLSQAEISRELGITQFAVLYGVRRLRLECADGKSKQRKFSDQELITLIETGLTRDRIAYELDVSESRVTEHARRLGKRLLTKTQAKERSQRDLLQQFIDEDLTPTDAANEYGIAVSTICYWEEKYNLHLKDGRTDVGEKITISNTHSEERALTLLKERTKDRFCLAEGERYSNSHQSYRFFCREHKEVHEALWTQIAYGNAGLKCCGEANRLLQGWDNLPENFADPGSETWVYLYETSIEGYCKVGVSVDVEVRAGNGGRKVYYKQHDKILCMTRLQARLLEEATLWEFRSSARVPKELLNEIGWSEIIQANAEEIWRRILDLYDAYDEEDSASMFCSRYIKLNQLTISQIESLCDKKGIDWQSIK